ncbi:MAG TPA: Gfo/Idh/MocA family oxidoreductase [Gemmataceae bacterium]|nr:Gfo/Idh/MocA family oxidoreductase [Gemmataceae bacterium]
MAKLTRRAFTQISTAALAAGTAWSAGRVHGANERVRLGFIGLGNRGDQVLQGFLQCPRAEVVAVCDLYGPYRDFASHKSGSHPEAFTEYRRLLDRKDIDAVVICTPDHWHALMTVHACQAGKDVYVEKPLSLCVAEGRAMVEAAHKHQRLVQVGLQRRSSGFVRAAVELVRNGAIGKVSVVRCFHIQNEWPKGIGNFPDEDPPKDFDWDAWLGPAPQIRYNRNRAFYRFRWFYDYSGGQLTNFGVHYVDVIQWALGHDAPLSVTAMGGRFALEDNREIPDTLEVLWTYPGGTLVTFSQFNATAAPAGVRGGEIEFRGTKGTLYLRSDGYEVVPEILPTIEFPARTPVDRSREKAWRANARAVIGPKKDTGRILDADHARNFLECVRSRQNCPCDVETGHRSTTAALVGNIALKTRSFLEWDGKAERFTNQPTANGLLAYRYRPPHRFPVG